MLGVALPAGESFLVTQIQLGHSLVMEALLPLRARCGMGARCGATPTKQSFGDKGISKLELGNEGKTGMAPERNVW